MVHHEVRAKTGTLRVHCANLLLAMASLCVSLLLIELALRYVWPPQEPLQVGQPAWNFRQVYTPPKNRLGFREEELNAAILSDQTVRILFLGDSFTFGWGVANGSDRFSDIIEKRLNQELTGTYHIYNAAIAGTAPEFWVKQLRQLYRMYKPQYVFAVFSLRDGTLLCTSLSCHHDMIESIRNNYVFTFAYRHFALRRLMAHTQMLQDFNRYYVGAITDAYLGPDDHRSPWRVQQDALVRMQEFCHQHGLELHLIVFPLLFGLDDSYPFHDVEREIARFAAEASIPVHSLTSGFLGQVEETLWVSAGDQHPNEKANRIAAETLWPYLKRVIGGHDRLRADGHQDK